MRHAPSFTTARTRSPRMDLDRIQEASPLFWLGLLLFSLPWLRIEEGGLTFYPGHLALGLLLTVMLAHDQRLPSVTRGLWPLFAAGGFMALVSALRGEAAVALGLLSVLVFNGAWGGFAYILSAQRRSGEALRGALVLALAAGMLPGVTVWIIQAFWPGACVALPCSEGELWPFLFRGGWLSPAQYQLILLFFLPLLGEPLLGGALSGHQGMTRGLLVLAGLLFAGLLAGGHPLGLALAVCGLALVALAAWRSRSRGLMQFSMRASAWGLFITLTFFGLFPGYMGALVAPEESRRQVRLEPVTPPPAEAPSGHNIPVTLKVANTGWISLPAGLGAPPRVAARILFNSGSGETRELPMDSVTLGQPLQPGQSALVNLEITPPHWLKAGYLDWLVLDPAGRALPEHEAGHQGIRLKNTAYQNLAHGPGNRLSSLTRNSREIFSHTRQVEDYQAARRGKTSLAGSMLDTLVFSPLWGLKPAGQTAWAFDRPLPFFPQVLSRYGILGLALVLLVMARTAGALVGIIRRERNRLGWQLALLALALLFAAGWFTPEAGSYHVIWAWFLFFGWTEGRLASFSRTGA